MIALLSLAALALPPLSVQDAEVSHGLRLLKELRCTACHAAPPELTELLTPPPGPDLTKVGERVLRDYFLDYLVDPAGHKPHTSMPNLFAGRGAQVATGMARPIAHFLANRGEPIDTTPTPTTRAELERGRQLFHGVGCVACHSPIETVEDLDTPWWEFETPASFDALAGEPDLGEVVLLGDLASKTTVKALSSFLLEPHVARPAGRMPNLDLEGGEAHAIATYLLRHQLVNSVTAPGLHYEYFEAPGFATTLAIDLLGPVRSGSVADLSALPEHRNDDFAFRFAGEIEVPSSGEWTFWTASDDGSRLWIDGELLVNNDGIHGVKEVSAKRHLEAGLHSLEVRIFERAGGEHLVVQWQGPNQERGPLSPDVLSHSSMALAPQPASFETHPEADRVGASYFSKMRCYACHESGVTPKAKQPLKGIADLNVASPRGCLGEELNPQVPLYDITTEEITALYFAIDAIQGGETVTQSTSSQMKALRCTACHQRDGVGGPTAPRSAWFNVLDHADLGDEGRIPPTLEGVGAKLRGDWLRNVLLEGGTARPYMETRMPQYQHELVEPLAAAFLEEDWDEGSDELSEIDEEEIAFGQRLVGTGGLGCINCHTFAGHDSLGIPATDMSAMYTRLNQSWFHKLLFDPVALKMNTRMPDFWLNGESPVKDIHGGDIHKQIDAIWSYLSLGDAAPYPKGLIHSANEFELTPTDGPLHAGVFMRDMSPRVLVVGTPERIHYAFDIAHSRLGRAWAGVFFDAAGTWNGRAGGLEVPPVPWIDFAPGAPFAVLSDAAASWPGEMGREAGYRGLGRTMDEADMPTFRYSLGDVVVAEKPQPELRLGGARLVRAFSITGSANSDGSLYLRASAGSLTEGDGEWLQGGEVTLSVSGDGRAFLRGEGDSAELLVEINQLPANIEVTYTW